MGTNINTYLNFDGTAREAMEFYQSVLGGELSVMTFADSGGMGLPEAEQHKVMHAQIVRDGEFLLMGADSPSHMGHPEAGGFSVSLSGDDEDTLKGWWEGLSEGATVAQPLEKAPWGDWFGMLTDRFGTPWLVNIAGSAVAG